MSLPAVGTLPLTGHEREAFLDFQSLRMIFYGLTGIILWDWATTLRYECQVMRGKVPRTWAVSIYFAARYASILFVAGVLPEAGMPIEVSCGAVWIVVLLGITCQVSSRMSCWFHRDDQNGV